MQPNIQEVDKVNRLIQQSLPEEQKELVSDGYHTFMYAHRVKLFVALCNGSLQVSAAHITCLLKSGTT